jgi:hypothetical protein
LRKELPGGKPTWAFDQGVIDKILVIVKRQRLCGEGWPMDGNNSGADTGDKDGQQDGF